MHWRTSRKNSADRACQLITRTEWPGPPFLREDPATHLRQAHLVSSTLSKVGISPNPLYARAMSHGPADLLREHGIQVTAQRLALLRALSASPHATAEGLTDSVRAEIGSISRQSVYDTLSLLVESGLVRRIQPPGSPARYEDRVGDNHHHVICRDCGQLADVDCAAGSAPCLTAVDDQGYVIDEAEVAYWGRCPTCQQEAVSVTTKSPAGHA